MMNERPGGLLRVIRPYLLLACVAFTVGFVGYWALGRVGLSPVVAEPADAPISVPVSDPYDWNPPKRI